jgi:hypothetical protein
MEHCNSSKEIGHPGLLRGSSWILEVTIILLPFVFFFWMIPFVSDTTLGNDYPRYSVWHQMELMFSLKMGSFPLYVPGFAGGQSTSALTLGQMYHPLSYLAVIMPSYWEGKALEWVTLFRLVSLGFAHLALYRFLRKIRIGCAIAFLLSVITVYNLRMLDLFRYGASLESWSGFIFLCSAIGWNFIKPKQWLGYLGIIGSTYWLICSGHPQMMYYGLLGAGLFALAVPYLIFELNPEKRIQTNSLLRFWARIAVCCLFGLLLSSAYFLPFYFDFIKLNDARVAQSYQWADTHRDTLIGTLNNFFLPLRSDVHGAFGGSPLVLIAALMPMLHLFKIKIPRVIWIVWAITAIAFLHMQGARTPVHYLAWKFLPLYSNFRIAGRISLILPILNLLLLTWILHANKRTLEIGDLRVQISPATILAGIAFFAIGVYMIIPDSVISTVTSFSAVAIRGISWEIERFLFVLGVLTLLILMAHGICNQRKFLTGVLLCFISCLSLMGFLQHGTWIEPKKNTRTLTQLIAEKHRSLDYRRDPGMGLLSRVVARQIRESCLESFIGKVYCEFKSVENTDEAYEYLARGRLPDVVVIEDNTVQKDSYADSGAFIRPSRVSLVYSSFNRLIFNVRTNCPGLFGFAYPHTGHWRAWVNHQAAKVMRANGAAHAVDIPAGESQIEFRYWSHAAFWGMLISSLMFALIGAIISLQFYRNIIGILISVALLSIGIGAVSLWYYSLYTGDNLNAAYTWSSDIPAPFKNLAYGKKTYLASQERNGGYILGYGGPGVDGNYKPGTGFISGLGINPYLIFDLHDAHTIGSIVIYESRAGDKWNRRPLDVAISSDLQHWQKVGSISNPISEKPLKLIIEESQSARYLLIKATGLGRLSFDEVEILPP